MVDDLNHKTIILAIHENWFDGRPFSIVELQSKTGLSTSTVTRYLRKLVELHYILHSYKGFAGRHYRVSNRWEDSRQVIDGFEYAKILNI